MNLSGEMDRSASPKKTNEETRAGHGQLGQRNLWQAGGYRLQREFRVHRAIIRYSASISFGDVDCPASLKGMCHSAKTGERCWNQ